MSSFTQKWTVVAPLEPIEIGKVFDWRDWPLHLTIVPIFSLNMNSDQITELLAPTLESFAHVNTTSTEHRKLGGGEGPEATVFEVTAELQGLHETLSDTLTEQGAHFDTPQYMYESFLPHATVYQDKWFPLDQKMVIKELYLIDMYANNNGRLRRATQKLVVPT